MSAFTFDNSTEMVGGEMTNPADLVRFVKDTLNKSYRDRMALLKIEHAMVSLVRDPSRREHKFDPMTSYGRLLTHRCAELFNLRHYLDSPRPNIIQQATLPPNAQQCVTVYKPPGITTCRIPPVSPFQQWCTIQFLPPSPTSFCEAPPQAKSILKRDTQSLDEDAVVVPAPTRAPAPPRSKSFEQREEEYEKARRRIFEDGHEVVWDWEGGPRGDGDPDATRPKLLAPESKAGRLLKVHSLDQRAPPLPGTRNPVSKAHSFGGYGGRTTLARGDSISSTHSAPAPPTRILSGQGELARSSWRLSPSSSGYMGGSGRSDSVTPSPTSLAQGESIAVNLGEGQVGGLLWAITDMAAVPAGALIIHPGTGQPLTNSDGSLYHYDPARPPSNALLVPTQLNPDNVRVLTNPERRRSRLEKQRATLSPGTDPDSTSPGSVPKVAENEQVPSQAQNTEQPECGNDCSECKNAIDTPSPKLDEQNCQCQDCENAKAATDDNTQKSDNKTTQMAVNVTDKGTSPLIQKPDNVGFNFNVNKAQDNNTNTKNQATSPKPVSKSITTNDDKDDIKNKVTLKDPKVETIEPKSPTEDTNTKPIITNQFYRNNRRENEEYYEKKSLLDQISPDTLNKLAHMKQFEYYNSLSQAADTKAFEKPESYENPTDDRRDNYMISNYAEMHGPGYYNTPQQTQYYEQENMYDPSNPETHQQYATPQVSYHGLRPAVASAPLVYPGTIPYGPQPDMFQGPPPPILVQSPYRLPLSQEQAVAAHPYIMPEQQMLVALNPKPSESETTHCYQDSILGTPQVPYAVPGNPGWSWQQVLYSAPVPSSHAEDITQKVQPHHGAYMSHAPESINPANMAAAPPGFYQQHIVQQQPPHYYPYTPHHSQVIHPMSQAQFPVYQLNPGRSSVHSQESGSPGYQPQYENQMNAFVYPKVPDQEGKFNQNKSPKTGNSKGASNSGSSRATPLTAGFPITTENFPNLDVNFVNGLNNVHYIQQPMNYAAYPYNYHQDCIPVTYEGNIAKNHETDKNAKLYKDINSNATPRDSPSRRNDIPVRNIESNEKKPPIVQNENTQKHNFPAYAGDMEPVNNNPDIKNVSGARDKRRDAFKNAYSLSVLTKQESFDNGGEAQIDSKPRSPVQKHHSSADVANKQSGKAQSNYQQSPPSNATAKPPNKSQPTEQEKINAMKIITSTLSNTAKSFVPKNSIPRQPTLPSNSQPPIINNDAKTTPILEPCRNESAYVNPVNNPKNSPPNTNMVTSPPPVMPASQTVKMSSLHPVTPLTSAIKTTSPNIPRNMSVTTNASVKTSPDPVTTSPPNTVVKTPQNTHNMVTLPNPVLCPQTVAVCTQSTATTVSSNFTSTSSSNSVNSDSRVTWTRQQSIGCVPRNNNYNNFPKNFNRQNRDYRNSDRPHGDRYSPRNRSRERNYNNDNYNNKLRMQHSFDLPQASVTPSPPVMSQPFTPWNQRTAASPNVNYRHSGHNPTSDPLPYSSPAPVHSAPSMIHQPSVPPAMAVAAAINRAAENFVANNRDQYQFRGDNRAVVGNVPRNSGLGLMQTPPLQGQLIFRQIPAWARRLPTPALFSTAPTLLSQPRLRAPRPPHAQQTHFYR